MRGILLALAAVFVLATAVPARAAGAADGTPRIAAASTVYALQVPDKKIDINVTTGQGGGRRWYASPVWIAIGAVGAVVILLLLVLVARGGGGTTIVKE